MKKTFLSWMSMPSRSSLAFAAAVLAGCGGGGGGASPEPEAQAPLSARSWSAPTSAELPQTQNSIWRGESLAVFNAAGPSATVRRTWRLQATGSPAAPRAEAWLEQVVVRRWIAGSGWGPDEVLQTFPTVEQGTAQAEQRFSRLRLLHASGNEAGDLLVLLQAEPPAPAGTVTALRYLAAERRWSEAQLGTGLPAPLQRDSVTARLAANGDARLVTRRLLTAFWPRGAAQADPADPSPLATPSGTAWQGYSPGIAFDAELNLLVLASDAGPLVGMRHLRGRGWQPPTALDNQNDRGRSADGLLSEFAADGSAWAAWTQRNSSDELRRYRLVARRFDPATGWGPRIELASGLDLVLTGLVARGDGAAAVSWSAEGRSSERSWLPAQAAWTAARTLLVHDAGTAEPAAVRALDAGGGALALYQRCLRIAEQPSPASLGNTGCAYLATRLDAIGQPSAAWTAGELVTDALAADYALDQHVQLLRFQPSGEALLAWLVYRGAAGEVRDEVLRWRTLAR